MKKAIAVAATALAATAAVLQRLRARSAEQALWAEATDAVPPAPRP